MITAISNISIHEITKQDQSEFFKLIDKNRENLKQYLTWLEMTQKESDLDNWFIKGEELHLKKEGCNYKIITNDDIIGFIGIFMNDAVNRTFEFGYWIDTDWRRKGIMSSLISPLEEVCFKEFNARKIEIRCAVGNLSSNKVAQKNGYSFDRVIEKYREIAGRTLDYNVYGKKHG